MVGKEEEIKVQEKVAEVFLEELAEVFKNKVETKKRKIHFIFLEELKK